MVLTDSQMLDVTQDEANRLVAEIMEHYKADGWLLKAARPGRWYLKPPRAPKMTTTPLADVIGRDIHPYLPRGTDGKAWHTVLNEMQILLHTAKVNEERERNGKLPINSLWFWGGGRLPKIKPVSWSGLWSEGATEPGIRALGAGSKPGAARRLRRLAARGGKLGDHLVVLDELRQPQLYLDPEAWSAAAENLSTNGWRRCLPPSARARWGRRRC